jgi:hypothetical protein
MSTISPRNSIDGRFDRLERDRANVGSKVSTKPAARSPLVTVNTNKRTMFDYNFPGSVSSSLNSTPNVSRNNSICNDHVIDLMEREQDAIVLRLMKEIDGLKNEIKILKSAQGNKSHSKLKPNKKFDFSESKIHISDRESSDTSCPEISVITNSDETDTLKQEQKRGRKLSFLSSSNVEDSPTANKINTLSISHKRHPSISNAGTKKIRTDSESVSDENARLRSQIDELRQKLREQEVTISDLEVQLKDNGVV